MTVELSVISVETGIRKETAAVKRVSILFLVMILHFSGAGAEEVCFEETFRETEGVGEDFFIEESFPGDAFGAEMPEDMDEPEKRSIVTLIPEFESDVTDEQLKKDDWWKCAPVLQVKHGKKDGIVVLNWVQSDKVTGDRTALPANVKYYVYSYEYETGAWKQVKKVGAAKKPVTIAMEEWDPEQLKEVEVTYTGIGGKVTLKNQPVEACYMVRAEKNVNGVETYGLCSDTDIEDYEYDDPFHDDSWQKIRISSLFRYSQNGVKLVWQSEGRVLGNYRIVRTLWCGKDKRVSTVESNFTDGLRNPLDRNLITHQYNDSRIPEDATKVSYTIIPIKYNEDLQLFEEAPAGKIKSKTLKLAKEGWKNVYSVSVNVFTREAKIEKTPYMNLEWNVSGGIADSYVLSGFDGVVSFDYRNGSFLPTVGQKGGVTSIPAGDYSYCVRWETEDADYRIRNDWENDAEGRVNSEKNLVEILDRISEEYVEITDSAEKKTALGSLFSDDAYDVSGEFRVTAPAKVNKKLQVKGTVQPRLDGKKGVRGTGIDDYTDTWRWSPFVEALRQVDEKTVSFRFSPNAWEEGVEYEIGGLAGPARVKITKAVIKRATDSTPEEAVYTLRVEDSKDIGATAVWENPDDSVLPTVKSTLGYIKMTAKVQKPGKTRITIHSEKGAKGKGRVFGANIMVVNADQKAGAIVKSFDPHGLTFLALNPDAESYRVSIISGYYENFDNSLYSLIPDYVVFRAEDVRVKGSEGYEVPDSSAHVVYDEDKKAYTVSGLSGHGERVTVLVETILKDGTRMLNRQAMSYDYQHTGKTEPAGVYSD